MRKFVFVDTSFLIASQNEDDGNHVNAAEVLRDLRIHPSWVQLVYTDYIFDEFISYLKARNTPAKKVQETGNALLSSNSLQMYFINPTQFHAAWGKIQQYSDKAWSFTDCTSFIVMEELSMQDYLGYDEHFGQAGFVFWAGYQ